MRRNRLFVLGALLSASLVTPSLDAQTPPTTTPPAQPVATPPPPPSPPAPVDPRVAMSGNYGFVGGDRERNEVIAAIGRATDGMNFITGPIARGRLRDRNPVYGSIGLRFTPGFIEVLFDGRSFRSPDSGAQAPGRSVTNEPVQVSQRFDGNGHIVQVITSESGSKRSEFALGSDGATLSMSVTVTSGSLPRQLRYTLTFHRR